VTLDFGSHPTILGYFRVSMVFIDYSCTLPLLLLLLFIYIVKKSSGVLGSRGVHVFYSSRNPNFIFVENAIFKIWDSGHVIFDQPTTT
jgi:hypothetical protein